NHAAESEDACSALPQVALKAFLISHLHALHDTQRQTECKAGNEYRDCRTRFLRCKFRCDVEYLEPGNQRIGRSKQDNYHSAYGKKHEKRARRVSACSFTIIPAVSFYDGIHQAMSHTQVAACHNCNYRTSRNPQPVSFRNEETHA